MFAGETLEGSVARGCLQGAFYCPCFGAWVDELVELHASSCYTLVHADDTATLISGKFPNTILELVQEARV